MRALTHVFGTRDRCTNARVGSSVGTNEKCQTSSLHVRPPSVHRSWLTIVIAAATFFLPVPRKQRNVSGTLEKTLISIRKQPSVYDDQKKHLRPLEKNLPCTTLKNPLIIKLVGWLVVW